MKYLILLTLLFGCSYKERLECFDSTKLRKETCFALAIAEHSVSSQLDSIRFKVCLDKAKLTPEPDAKACFDVFSKAYDLTKDKQDAEKYRCVVRYEEKMEECKK